MKLIVGLGNPGHDHANQKHNVGHWVVDGLAKEAGWKWRDDSAANQTAWGEVEGEECWLAKPKSWMNISGGPVKTLLKEKKAALEDLVVVHDDLDLKIGQIRWVFDSGAGGHNGVQSVIDALGGKRFYRLRLGIGRPAGREDPADYVLKPFTGEELVLMEERAAEARKSVHDFLKHGLDWVRNKYN